MACLLLSLQRWKLLRTHSHRWRHAALFSAYSKMVGLAIEGLCEDELPLLESLYVWTGGDAPDKELNLGFKAPVLKSLKLSLILPYHGSSVFNMLTKLTLNNSLSRTSYTMTSLLCVLRNCTPTLSHLILAIHIWDSDNGGEDLEGHHKTFSMPRLEHLAIGARGELDWGRLLTTMDLPHLQVLVVDMENLDSFMLVLISIEHVFHTVRYLALRPSTPIYFPAPPSLLDAFPALQCLKVSQDSSIDCIL